MRPFKLAQIAMEAEGLRLRRHARRTLIRLVIGYFALLTMFGALVFAHVTLWWWLRETLPGVQVAAIFTGVDLLLTVVLGLIAARSSPGRVELEALALRRQALEDAAGLMRFSTLTLGLVELLLRRRGRP